MKKIYLLGTLAFGLLINSCTVQQHCVNTKIVPFENGGRFFGEKTNGLRKGTDYVTGASLFFIGINAASDDTHELITKLGADKYTIETRGYLIGNLCWYFTGGLVKGTKTTVFKRSE
jgi:hypothetical protein